MVGSSPDARSPTSSSTQPSVRRLGATMRGNMANQRETTFLSVLDTDPALLDVRASSTGPAGALPLTEELLRHAPSGELFGWSQNVGMGWRPDELNRREFLLLSTSGGLRADDGTPIALGYHSGHWEVGLLMKAAAQELRALNC